MTALKDFSHMVRKTTPVLPALALVLPLLAACSNPNAVEDNYVERPVTELYNEAMDFLEEENYEKAVPAFEEVERQHPYSKWATKAQMMAAYTYYLGGKYDDAVVALDRFIQLHPSSPDVPYAHYLKGLCYYEQISDVARDQKMTELAMATLRELVTRFPESRYSRDAKVKIELTHDHLAGKEMDIGRTYLRQGHYLAAINRFKVVVARFQTTTHVPEALHRLVESYYALGITEEAEKAAAVLGHNFPGSEWYIDSFEMLEKVKVRPSDDDDEDEPWYKFW